MNELQRKYQEQEEVKRIAVSLAKDIIIQETKELILHRAFKPNFAGNQAAINARDEGNLDASTNLFGLPMWDLVELCYNPEDLSAKLNICQIEIIQSRNIITTAIQGLDGTVKEFISNGDAQIRIKATIVGKAADYYPAEDIKQIAPILDIKFPLDIYSTILNKYLNINSVVITDWTLNQPEEGMRNVQTLDISCISDSPNIYKIIMKA